MRVEVDVGRSRRVKESDLEISAANAAQFLLGCQLFTNIAGKPAGGIIIKTEAYDEEDPFAHCYNRDGCNPKTDSAPMLFGAGNLYLYYPLCFNVTSGVENFGSAVLIRALHPICGEQEMLQRWQEFYGAKDSSRPDRLCDGPTNVSVALGINDNFYKEPYFRGTKPLTVLEEPFELWTPRTERKFTCTARINLDRQRAAWSSTAQ